MSSPEETTLQSTASTEECDLRQFIANLILKTNERIDKAETNLKDYITVECTKLQNSIDKNTKDVNVLKGDVIEIRNSAKENTKDIHDLATRVYHIEEENTNLKGLLNIAIKTNDTQAVQISTLRYRLEDQTNRNCRQTLIIRGIREKPNETWKETKQLLSDTLANICKLDQTKLPSKIMRAHRGPTVEKEDKKFGARDIHALFFDWNTCQEILSGMIKHGKGKKVYVEQRYGPDTTARRNLAKIERRDLLDAEKVVNGFVDYPARLMVKYHETDEHYTLHKDYSNVDVSLEPREKGKKGKKGR